MESEKLADREIESVTKRTGTYIPPSRMADLVRIAQEVIDLFPKADPGISFYEIRIALNIAMYAVREAAGLNIDRR